MDKQYRTLIPVVINGTFDKESVLSELRRAGADAVMLALMRPLKERLIPDYYGGYLDGLIRFFEQNGMDCGVWIGESIGHWCASSKKYAYRSCVDILGQEHSGGFCPADDLFANDLCEYIANTVRSGAKFILIDDDFRMSNHGTELPGCTCEYHMKKLADMTGEPLSRSDVMERVFSGKPNKVRDAWLTLQGETLYTLAKKIRDAVDAVDDTVRIGLCTGAYITDFDGTDLAKLARIFAGKTKPFIRCCGAPYWAGLTRLGAVCNYERYLCFYAKENGIECVTEADTYPRPRYYCPASFLQLFEEIMVADGSTNGVLHYSLDYASSPTYETGYIDARVKDEKRRRFLAENFSDKKACGVRVFAEMHLLRGADLSEEDPNEICRRCGKLPQALLLSSDLSIPVTTDMSSDGAVLVTGENARYLTDTWHGVITDIPGALALQKRGIDAGLASVGKLPDESIYDMYTVLEKDNETGETTGIGMMGIFDIEVKDGAKVLSTFISENKQSVGAYLYENDDGMRFMVLPFDTDRDIENANALCRSYMRQRQVEKALPYLTGKSPDATCFGHPYLYIMTKKDKNSLVIGLWNLFADEVERPVITVAPEYSGCDISFTETNGVFSGNTVTLDTIPAYGFAAVTLTKK